MNESYYKTLVVSITETAESYHFQWWRQAKVNCKPVVTRRSATANRSRVSIRRRPCKSFPHI